MVQGLIECAVRCGVPRSGIANLVHQSRGSKSASMPPARYAAQHVFALWERLVQVSGDAVIGFRIFAEDEDPAWKDGSFKSGWPFDRPLLTKFRAVGSVLNVLLRFGSPSAA
jgi:hypothetical protein